MKIRLKEEQNNALTFTLQVTEQEMLSGSPLIQKLALARALGTEISFDESSMIQESSSGFTDTAAALPKTETKSETDIRLDRILTDLISEKEFSFSEEELDAEVETLFMGTLKQMQYARMFADPDDPGQVPDLRPADPDALRKQIRKELIREKQEEQIIQEVITRENLTVTPEDLARRAEKLAAEQQTDLSMIRRFFGDDYAGLIPDILTERARKWLLEHTP